MRGFVQECWLAWRYVGFTPSEMIGELVVFSMGKLPCEIGHEERCMGDHPNDVIEQLRF